MYLKRLKLNNTNKIQKLIIVYSIIAIIYGFIYFFIKGNNNFNGLTEYSTLIDCLYFSFTTTSTVGYGDISPKSQIAKIIVITHQIILLSEIFYIFIPNK